MMDNFDINDVIVGMDTIAISSSGIKEISCSLGKVIEEQKLILQESCSLQNPCKDDEPCRGCKPLCDMMASLDKVVVSPSGIAIGSMDKNPCDCFICGRCMHEVFNKTIIEEPCKCITCEKCKERTRKKIENAKIKKAKRQQKRQRERDRRDRLPPEDERNERRRREYRHVLNRHDFLDRRSSDSGDDENQSNKWKKAKKKAEVRRRRNKKVSRKLFKEDEPKKNEPKTEEKI